MDEFARPVAYLNPKPGSPTVADSHACGPMLWPADEPWPWCDGVAQLYARDFPELLFPDGTDLLLAKQGSTLARTATSGPPWSGWSCCIRQEHERHHAR